MKKLSLVSVAGRIIAFAGILLVKPALAGPLTFEFHSEINYSEVPAIVVGEAIEGSYAFDTAQPDLNAHAAYGFYPILAGTVRVAGYEFELLNVAEDSMPAFAPFGSIGVFNDFVLGDGYWLNTLMVGPQVNGHQPLDLSIFVGIGLENWTDNDALALQEIPLSFFALKNLALGFELEVAPGEFERRVIRSELSFLGPRAASVPIPGPVWLVPLGLVGLLASRRRHWSRRA